MMTSLVRMIFLCISLLLVAGGCRCHSPSASKSTPSQKTDSSSNTPTIATETVKIRTTSAELALSNLNAQIDGFMKVLSLHPDDIGTAGVICNLLFLRSHHLGRISDYDLLMDLAKKALEYHPKDPAAYLLNAHAKMALHRFSDASSDLDHALALGALETQLTPLKMGILVATGRAEDVLPLRQKMADEHPGYGTLSDLAEVLAALGKFDEADLLYERALKSYRDVSPFPVAWLDFQRGVMWAEEAGDLTRARSFYEAAVARLPQYVVANVHLAEIEANAKEIEKAIARLEPLAKTAEDPEPTALLALLYQKAGNPIESDRLKQLAKSRYDDLLVHHLEAFADHAAEFFSGIGGDPKRALDLARQNLAIRPTQRAYKLFIQTALKAEDPLSACETAKQALAKYHPHKPLQDTINLALQTCHHTP